MKIYIASSWKNQHAVEMLTFLLREQGHEILSFIENNFGENPDSSKNTGKFDFESWVNSDKANQSFAYDTNGAMFSDLVIYISPSGKDAAAECGMAYARGVPIIGLAAKGEDFGLMRKMMSVWCQRFTEVLEITKNWDTVKAWHDHKCANCLEFYLCDEPSPCNSYLVRMCENCYEKLKKEFGD